MDPPSKRNRPAETSPEPSPVIHLRFLPRHTLEKDLRHLFEAYGSIREITMLPHKYQALLEFEDVENAEHVVETSATNPFKIGSSTIQVTFSKSKRIVQRGGSRYSAVDDLDESNENKVLLLTAYNAYYPMTIDVLFQIASPFGKVVRIVLFRKEELQAMVEMDTVESARNVKCNLSGGDIYNGCCSLKIEYARPTRLTVHRNDADAWDFEIINEQVSRKRSAPGSSAYSPMNRNKSLLGSSPGQWPFEPTNGYSAPPFLPPSISGSGQVGRQINPFSSHQPTYPTAFDHLRTQTPNNFSQPLGYGQAMSLNQQNPHSYPICANGSTISFRSHTSVAMVYNLDVTRMNCDRLFNILCIYGNVDRIKFLRTHEGCAMVQMGDSDSVDRAIANMSGSQFMDTQLVIRTSKQNVLVNVPQPFKLADGTPSFKDYSQSQNNRYGNPRMASKNRKYRPSRALHYWNCPPNMEFAQIISVFTAAAAPVPIKMTPYEKTVGGRSSSGVLLWTSESDAMTALAICNHTELPASITEGAGTGFLLKLSFASTFIRDKPDGSGGGKRGSPTTTSTVATTESRSHSDSVANHRHSPDKGETAEPNGTNEWESDLSSTVDCEVLAA